MSLMNGIYHDISLLHVYNLILHMDKHVSFSIGLHQWFTRNVIGSQLERHFQTPKTSHKSKRTVKFQEFLNKL